MSDLSDLELLIKSRIPILLIETHEELRALELLKSLSIKSNIPFFVWSVTAGLQRQDLNLDPQMHNAEPDKVLKHIKSSAHEGIYTLLDFDPYLGEPVNERLIKEISQNQFKTGQHLVFISHNLDSIPDGLKKFSARFKLSLPNKEQLVKIIQDVAFSWSQQNGKKVTTDSKTLEKLVQNLAGLTRADAVRLVRKVIFDDGAITSNDLPGVMQAKYDLLDKDGLLAFEYETEQFAEVGGMGRIKHWLELRKNIFHSEAGFEGLDPPKGILLLGVQGCGKSLISKAVAGVFGIPLLRIDFGVLYNKFFGESEKNLRESLKTAEVMEPCVLWIDEIEKGISTGDNDGGTSRRVLGSLLTWMAEKKKKVFLVATANDIEALPPELIRKGRFDEIFFVDLPSISTRSEIFRIHLEKRAMPVSSFDIEKLAEMADGFSGAEIEQAIVSSLYTSLARGGELVTADILQELENTRPLSVVMAEKINYLRDWASSRTVSAE